VHIGGVSEVWEVGRLVMIDDSTKPTVFTSAFSVSHSSFPINSTSRISHLLLSTLVSAFQILFIIVGLV